MKRRLFLRTAGIFILISMLGAYGCILNPEEGGGGGGGEIEWPDLTDKEDPITTIQLCYNNYQNASINELMDHYVNVLYDDPDDVNDYVWYMQPDDVAKYGEIMTLEQDINGTRFVLENANPLTLELSGVSWDPAPEVCDECYKTTKTYSITATFIIEGEPDPYQGMLMRVTFVVGPHHDDPGKWAIYLAQDLPPAS